MSGKVRITQEQAEKLEEARERYKDDDIIVIRHAEKYYECKFDELFELTTAELARALYIGYEVEPEFKEGDWVVVDGYSKDYNGKVLEITEIYKGALGLRYCKFSPSIDKSHNFCLNDVDIRHATPEEIAKEKERRWWAKHDRDVCELKQGDVLIKLCSSFDFEALEVENVDDEYITLDDYRQINYKTTNMKINYKVICFVHDRKDMQA